MISYNLRRTKCFEKQEKRPKRVLSEFWPKIARILPEFCPNFARIKYIGNFAGEGPMSLSLLSCFCF